ICKFFGNITQSRVSKLCCIGVDIISKDERYGDIINKFITEHAAAA
ncbi:MAG TPA: transposase, partial [Clostridiaceae bacterium]|nr:transposase [Clostridiaceae bacterium]HBF77651.1 transposase [Clostridiaceae bacterium]HBN28610.1 transposase [Clostridiaceae bacterium]